VPVTTSHASVSPDCNWKSICPSVPVNSDEYRGVLPLRVATRPNVQPLAPVSAWPLSRTCTRPPLADGTSLILLKP
jgi:hypothetical protein